MIGRESVYYYLESGSFPVFDIVGATRVTYFYNVYCINVHYLYCTQHTVEEVVLKKRLNVHLSIKKCPHSIHGKGVFLC